MITLNLLFGHGYNKISDLSGNIDLHVDNLCRQKGSYNYNMNVICAVYLQTIGHYINTSRYMDICCEKKTTVSRAK